MLEKLGDFVIDEIGSDGHERGTDRVQRQPMQIEFRARSQQQRNVMAATVAGEAVALDELVYCRVRLVIK